MRVKYDIETDSLTITLREGEYQESDEISPGVIVDYDINGNLYAIEIL